MKIVIFTLLSAFFCNLSLAMGEKYSEEGHKLSRAIDANMIKEGFCKNTLECFQLIDSYGGHGNQVNLTFYKAKNPELIKSIVGFVLVNGLKNTNGVPIKLYFHTETRESQGNLIFKKSPTIYLEITK
jgi:hypothetical protein